MLTEQFAVVCVLNRGVRVTRRRNRRTARRLDSTRRDLVYREVRLEIDADDRRLYRAAERCENGVASDRQLDVDARRSTGTTMGVRDDVALWIDNHVEPRKLRGDKVCCATRTDASRKDKYRAYSRARP